jgi:transketolase
MRATFIRTLAEVAAADERVMLLTGDLGFTVVEPFADAFPDRFVNVGVAEQNMVGLATGLAEAGFVPYVYSIATFATLRPYEFVRNGPVLHALPVRIVGVGGGLEYGANGVTHYALEDVAVMRTQPGMTVVAPADHQQARSALLGTVDLPGPIYFRLGKDETTTVPGLDGRFGLGRAQRIRVGEDIVILAMGPIAREAVRAADMLVEHGHDPQVYVVSCVSPAPTDDLVDALANARLAITLESHYVTGGLASLVSEVVAGNGLHCRVVPCGVESVPRLTGSEAFLNELHGLTAAAVVAAAIDGPGRPAREIEEELHT